MTGVSDTSTTINLIAAPTPTTSYTADYAYDAHNRLTGVTFGDVSAAATPASPQSVEFGHTYNAVNQRIGQTASDNSWIEYPSSASTTSYTANVLNQYTAVGAVSPTYDANANLTSDGTLTLGYDAENRLVSASGGGNTASYTYDGRGRRKTKTVNGTTTVFVTDADNREVLEYNEANGAILRWFVHGLGPNDVLAQIEAGGTRYTPVPDLLGSIIEVMNASTGVMTKYGYPHRQGRDCDQRQRRGDPLRLRPARPAGAYHRRRGPDHEVRLRRREPPDRDLQQGDPARRAADAELDRRRPARLAGRRQRQHHRLRL